MLQDARRRKRKKGLLGVTIKRTRAKKKKRTSVSPWKEAGAVSLKKRPNSRAHKAKQSLPSA